MMRLLALCLLGICINVRADVFVRDDINVDPEPGRFTVCHDNGCTSLSHLGLTGEQWSAIRRLFEPPPRNAETERERLRIAIATMEKFVGEAIGTWQDKGGTFNGGGGQMDCIDESINTTLYLKMFRKHGLMRHHSVEDRATRGWFLFGWPHTSAVVSEDGNGKLWAVDSWFLDNGESPFVLPLETWESGWKPIR
ncbi:MAG: hypothetical protein HS110_03735 [Zoogloeaceae bacterium]|nr:hypothetical protein [Zoogloeaceae bacterium]MCK6385420.1 hypothetical protein [Rhodocyclaceae bacterium]